MKELSLKGIGAGLLAMLVLSIPLSLMLSYYFVAIYNDVAPGVNLMNEIEVQEMEKNIFFHPLSIASVIISTFIFVGVPSYIASLIAKKAFILNAMAIGFISVLLSFIEFDLVTQYPFFFSTIILFNLIVAYMAGLLRYKQVTKSAQ